MTRSKCQITDSCNLANLKFRKQPIFVMITGLSQSIPKPSCTEFLNKPIASNFAINLSKKHKGIN